MGRLRPSCETLEGRAVLSTVVNNPWEIGFFTSLPSFRNDAQAMHDVQAFKADENLVVAQLKGPLRHPGGSKIRRDELAIDRALSGPGKNPQTLAQIHADPAFHTLSLTNPSTETGLRATLDALHVPAPLVDRLFADRQALINAVGQTGSGAMHRLDDDLRLLTQDALRTGTITVGDPAYNDLMKMLTDQNVTLSI